jgi:hypothetical protein
MTRLVPASVTPEEAGAIVADYLAGDGTSVLAGRYHHNVNAISAILRASGVTFRRSGNPQPPINPNLRNWITARSERLTTQFRGDLGRLPESTIGWLAGLLEGEGYFGIEGQRNGRYRRPSRLPIIVLKMTDQDIVNRVGGIMSTKVQVQPQTRPNRKTVYVASVRGTRARLLCEMILPYMGDRRSQRIREMLALPGYAWSGHFYRDA